MKITKKKLSELHKTDKNIRRHSEKQIQEYIRSLEMFGQIRPLVVTDDGEILIGNGMYEALASMGKEECDVYVVNGLSVKDRRKLMLADNKVYELGFTDIGLLDDILHDLEGDFDIPGYNEDILKAITATEEETTKSILNYSEQPFKLSDADKTDENVTYSEDNSTHYEPPVQTADGAFINPATVNAGEENADNRPFVVCPKCGEKIWL